MAIEFVRMSELCIVILSALSFGNKFDSVDGSASVRGGFSDPKAVVALGGDADEVDDTIRIPADDIRKPCEGDIDRFCGEPMEAVFVVAN